MTRVAAYSSKLLRNVPRWRLSKASTAPSRVRPANALSSTDRETPAAAASRDRADRKALKSPPHVAAPACAAKSRVQNRMPSDRNSMPFLNVRPGDHRNVSSYWEAHHSDRRPWRGPAGNATVGHANLSVSA